MISESLTVDANDALISAFQRLGVELAVLIIIIPIIYRRFHNNREHLFPFFLMGIMVFLVCVILKNVEIQMGMVLGLFAIFSILRFRTYNFSTKDMSYLFAVIGVSAINAMLDYPRPIRGTLLFNSVVILSILGLELYFRNVPAAIDPKEAKKKNKDKKDKKKDKVKDNSEDRIVVVYNRLDLLTPANRDLLLKDLSARSGREITGARVTRLDLVRGEADIEGLCAGKNETS
ncbi:MAG: DUF4956 domain-containing protein [Bacteroidales bacterium]|jgi:hypothetical protein|nr:DUF4956 domain-containing protein [Bacteroidales bacterium]